MYATFTIEVLVICGYLGLDSGDVLKNLDYDTSKIALSLGVRSSKILL